MFTFHKVNYYYGLLLTCELISCVKTFAGCHNVCFKLNFE